MFGSWSKYRLKYIAKIAPSVDISNISDDDEVTFLPMAFIRNGYFIPNSVALKDLNSSYNSFQNGDILMAKVTPCFENGNITIAENLVNGFGYGTSEIFVIRADTTKVLNTFLFYLLQEYDFKSYAISDMTGTGGLKRVSSSFVSDYSFNIPSLSKQKIVIDFLIEKSNKVDALIENEEKIIDELKEYKKSIIQKEIESKYHKWDRKRFTDVFELGKGLNITKADLQDEGIPVVSYGEIHSKYGRVVNPDINQLKFVKEEYLTTDNKSLLKYGDFVYADTSEDLEGSGSFTFLNSQTPVFAGYHTIIARPKMEIDFLFLSFLCDSYIIRSQIQSQVTGIKVFSITKGLLKNVDMWLPPLPEQKSIGAYLNKKSKSVDDLIAIKQQKISELKEYKKSLIYEYVTGKKEPQKDVR